MRTISITGTKGKTTIVFLLDLILRKNGFKTICVNSNGIFKNGKTLKNNNYFLKKYKTSANASALSELLKMNLKNIDFLILENSFSIYKKINSFSEKIPIDISILTNVYKDHIDGKETKNQQDLFEKKYRIIQATRKKGSVIIFSDEKNGNLSYKAISRIKKERPDLKLITYNKKATKNKNCAFFKKSSIYLNNRFILDIKKLYFPFYFRPPALDLNLIPLSLILKSIGVNPKKLYSIKNIYFSVPGRLNFFRKKESFIFLDLSHEKESLKNASIFLRKNFPKKKVKAVIRLSYYRTDPYIKKLTKELSNFFDEYIIYDKAASRKEVKDIFLKKYNRKTGDVAKLMLKTLLKLNKKVIRVNNELKAIKFAIETFDTEKEILYIIGDQIEKDLKTIKKYI